MFEICLYELLYDTFIYGDVFVSPDIQFGFSKGKGCRDALFVLKSCVDFFVKQDSTMNIALLDLNKAFDNVNFNKLFSVLIKNNVNKKFWMF